MRPTRIVPVLILLLATPPALQAQAPATLPDFAVEDQFKHKHTEAELANTPVVILVTNREGREPMLRWFALLSATAPEGTRILMAADTKGAPFFVKGAIRGGMPKDTLQPVLLDYSGKLARALRGGTDTLIAAVFGADGALRDRRVLSTTTEDTATATALLRAAAP